MSYQLNGTYITNCNCRGICPCPMDIRPTGANDECIGLVLWHIVDGECNDVSLSDLNFVWYNVFPSNILAGNWKTVFVIDDRASDEQAEAMERILKGTEGGFFEPFVALITDFRDFERAPITFEDGEKPSGTVGTRSTVGVEPLLGQDGAPTIVKNPPFGFGPEYRIGKGIGATKGPFGDFEHIYGETGPFEFTSQDQLSDPRSPV